MIICGANSAKKISIKSKSYGYFLACEQHCALDHSRCSYIVHARDDDNDDEAVWEVEYIDRNTVALKNEESQRYLSAQKGIL